MFLYLQKQSCSLPIIFFFPGTLASIAVIVSSASAGQPHSNRMPRRLSTGTLRFAAQCQAAHHCHALFAEFRQYLDDLLLAVHDLAQETFAVNVAVLVEG